MWTDLAIEQNLMRAIKTAGGLTGWELRNHKSAHKVWVSTLNHLTSLNERFISVAEANKKKSTTVVHPDLENSAVKKDNISFNKALDWFKDNFNLDQDSDVLMSLSSGLVSKSGKDAINAENCVRVGV